MDWHHETQPMPNPLSWFFHHLPRPVHRIEVVGNFVAQLVLPFGLFLPQPFASVAAVLMIGTQLYLVVSGNYAWLNWVTIVILAAAIDDPDDRGDLRLVPGADGRARRRAGLVRGRGPRPDRPRRRAQLVPGPQPAQPAPGDERVVRSRSSW